MYFAYQMLTSGLGSEVHTNSVVAMESIIRQIAINPITQKRWGGLQVWGVWRCWIERALCGRGGGRVRVCKCDRRMNVESDNNNIMMTLFSWR